MPINAVQPSSGANAAASLNQTEFLKLLLTQLQNQDPLKPVDNKDFVVQMAQFSALAQMGEINQNVADLLSFQSSNQAVALLGKRVDVRSADGSSRSGTVRNIDFSAGEPALTVEISTGVNINATMGQVTAVR